MSPILSPLSIRSLFQSPIRHRFAHCSKLLFVIDSITGPDLLFIIDSFAVANAPFLIEDSQDEKRREGRRKDGNETDSSN
jgi:hypothetical protein